MPQEYSVVTQEYLEKNIKPFSQWLLKCTLILKLQEIGPAQNEYIKQLKGTESSEIETSTW